MYEHMLVYLYNVVFDCIHLSELFTYPNKMFVAFDQWGSDNRGFTVVWTGVSNQPHDDKLNGESIDAIGGS